VITTYTQPTDYEDEWEDKKKTNGYHVEGVASLLKGEQLSLEPEVLARKERHN